MTTVKKLIAGPAAEREDDLLWRFTVSSGSRRDRCAGRRQVQSA